MKCSDNDICACRKWLYIFFPYTYLPNPRRTPHKSWDRCHFGSVKRGECLKSWIKRGVTQGISIDALKNNIVNLDFSSLADQHT
jgi:hypothetical protein